MFLKLYGKLILVFFAGLMMVATTSCKNSILGETALVVTERMEVRNSISRVSKMIAELKRGDQVTIVERDKANESNYVRIQGPEGLEGWADVRNLVLQSKHVQAQEFAQTIANIPNQADGRSRSSIKLRLTPDRSNDENVIALLPTGTEFEIADRENHPKRAPAKSGSEGEDKEDPSEVKGAAYEIWYRVRVKNNPVAPAGYAYGGSVELIVPYEITYYSQPDRKIVGWQRLGSLKDDRGQEGHHFVIFQKAYKNTDEKCDFDYLQILGFDPRNRSVSYYNVHRGAVRGVFPVIPKIEEKKASFEFKALDNNDQQIAIQYKVELNDRGHMRATVPPQLTTASKK